MILDATTKSIEFLLGGTVSANQISSVASWTDIAASTTTPGMTTASSNNATAVAIVPAPGASTQRKIRFINIFNADTAAVTVTVRLNNNGTFFPITTIALPVGYTLQYTDIQGWNIINSSGGIQVSGSSSFTVSPPGVLGIVGAPVSVTAATTLVSPTLNLNADTTYIIEASLQNATGSGSVISLFFNADTTSSNYDEQCNTINNASASPSRGNDARIGNLDASDFLDLEITIWVGRDGKPQAMVRATRNSGTGIVLQEFRLKWRTANTNVTLVTISSSVSSALTGVMRVYRKSPSVALSGWGYNEGAAFPSSPVNGQKFYRTDLNLLCYYDGTRWLSAQIFRDVPRWTPAAGGSFVVAAATIAAGSRGGVPYFHGGSDIWLLNWHSQFSVQGGGTALDGSNFWTCTLKKYDATVTGTTISTFTINSGSSSSFRVNDTAINALLSNGTPYYLFATDFTKTGTPGGLEILEEISYRIVVT